MITTAISSPGTFKDRGNILGTLKKDIFPYLPTIISEVIAKISINSLTDIEEIRLRAEKPIMLVVAGENYYLTTEGKLSKDAFMTISITQLDILRTLELMCESSMYAFQEEIKNGYITLKGGHRVGLCGRTVIENGSIKYIRDISAMNIRVAREVIGCADKVIRHIVKERHKVLNTLIISAPKCGKTTLLRDIARQLSDGIPGISFEGAKVSIIDERSEIAACFKGVAQNRVGLRTDVLDSCPKQEGMLLLLRAMSPEVIITDEIGAVGDSKTIMQLHNSGVSIVTSAHGYDIDDMKVRYEIIELIKSGVFERIIVLDSTKGPGTIRRVVNGLTMEEIDLCC